MLIRVAVVEDETELYDYYGKLLEAWGKTRKNDGKDTSLLEVLIDIFLCRL